MSTQFYDVIHRRRDARGQFTGAPLDAEVLDRILTAAHAAPSVGLTQPWDFSVVRDRAAREAFHRHVRHERDVFAASLDTGAAQPALSGPASSTSHRTHAFRPSPLRRRDHMQAAHDRRLGAH